MSEWSAESLAGRRCRPCEGGVPPLSDEEVDRALVALPGWDRREDEIVKTFSFRNYYEVIAFVNAIAWIAHTENHHPDLEVGFRQVTVRYSTHAIHGLSEKDLICAAQVNALVQTTD